MRLGSSTDKKDSGRLHVDFAQARDDFYEWECKQRMLAREERHRRKMEEDRLRPPSPPAIMHYSEHEAALLAEKLKGKQHLILCSALCLKSRSHPEVRTGEVISLQCILLPDLLAFPHSSAIFMSVVMILTHLLGTYSICPSSCALAAKTQLLENYRVGFFSTQLMSSSALEIIIRQVVTHILHIKTLILKMLLFNWEIFYYITCM